MINTLNCENLIIDVFRTCLKDLRDKEKDIRLIHVTNDLMDYLDDYVNGKETSVPIRSLSDINHECDCDWSLDVIGQIDDNDIKTLTTILTEIKYSYSGRDLELIGLNKDDIQRLLDKFKVKDK